MRLMNIVIYPHPKINIGLRIVNRRPDGFHDIETLFYPVDNFKDVLEITESEVFSFNRYGNPYPLKDENPENDLCVKAYRLLERDFNLPPASSCHRCVIYKEWTVTSQLCSICGKSLL